MEYGTTAWSDAKISRILQGTIMLTERQKEEGFRLLDAVWETGINAFDTAALYGGGTCERVLGQWMEARGNREDCFVIGKSAHHNRDRPRVTPFDITADLHDSLARQRTEYQDLHLLHRDDPTVEVGPLVEILNEHRICTCCTATTPPSRWAPSSRFSMSTSMPAASAPSEAPTGQWRAWRRPTSTLPRRG